MQKLTEVVGSLINFHIYLNHMPCFQGYQHIFPVKQVAHGEANLKGKIK